MQPALPFAPRVVSPPPWFPSASQVAGAELLSHLIRRITGARGGLTVIVLTGPAGSGKSRLAREVLDSADDIDAVLMPVSDLDPLDLFAEINTAAAAGGVLLLEDRRALARWFTKGGPEAPPDLVSRLSAAPKVSLESPGPESLRPLLLADLAEHGHRLSERELAFVTGALPRDFGGPRRFCRALDRSDAGMTRLERLKWSVEQAHVRGEPPDMEEDAER